MQSDVRTILEVGSGNGEVIYTFYTAGYDPIVLDISFNSLNLINGSKRVQGEVSILPFPPNSFDLVLAFELIEHILNSTFSSVLDEISTVARKYIIIIAPFRERLEWNYARSPACGCIFNGAYHARSFGNDELKYLFNGFKCMDLRKIVNVLYPDSTISLSIFVLCTLGHLPSMFYFS